MLDVTKNNLTFIPPEVSQMTQLTELKIGSNQLKEVSLLTELMDGAIL